MYFNDNFEDKRRHLIIEKRRMHKILGMQIKEDEVWREKRSEENYKADVKKKDKWWSVERKQTRKEENLK